MNVIFKTSLFFSMLFILLMFSCKHVAINNSVPALLSDTDIESKTELRKAVSQLLNQKEVFIAQDAFKKRSFISVERLAREDSHGNRIQGRELDMPEKIQLVLVNGECFLKRESNNSLVKLKNVKCFPEK
jgi:hypothetical protein